MDSGKSGSLQSSSGGDDEYDSRGDSISALLAQPPQHVVVDCISHHPQPPHSTANAAMYNPFLSKLFEQPLPPLPGEHNSTPVRNLDAAWSKTLRPDINPMLASSTSSSPPNTQPLGQQRVPGGGLAGQSAPVSFPLAAEQHVSGTGGATTAAAAGGMSDQTHVVRNPKKRSRASRRAPTTVLTTDTTNFRAMVQEFTGIPAPPFTSLPFSKTRLDSLGSPSAVRSGAASHFDNIRQSPSYLRRPFAQKIQPLQPAFLPPASSSFLPSTLVDVLASSTTNNIINISPGSSTISPSKYQHISQSASLLGISSNTSQLKMGGFLDAFGSANAALTALPSLISPSEASAAMSRRSENTPASWDGGGLRSKPNNADQGQSQPQSSNNNIFSCNAPAVNGKLNIPATSSNFHGYKAPENVGGSRGEGMVESWICSSE